jgi:hypothetical protein
VPVRQVDRRSAGEGHQRLDGRLGVGRGHGGAQVVVEEPTAAPGDDLEERAEQAGLAPGEPEHGVGGDELLPRVGHRGLPVGPGPQHPYVDEAGQAQLRALEPAQVDGAGRELGHRSCRHQVVERLEPRGLGRGVLGVGRDEIESLAGGQGLGDGAVEGGVVGVHHHLDLVPVEHVVEVVVHGSAHEGHAQGHPGAPFIDPTASVNQVHAGDAAVEQHVGAVVNVASSAR